MDFRAHQDNEMRTSGSLSYAAPTHHHHLATTKESSSSSPTAAADHQKRRVGIHNGTNNYTAPHPQTLDHPPNHIQQQQPPLPPLIRDPPDPDRALAGTPVAPAGLGSGGNKSSSKVIRYRECLKNHAANIGGNVFDGCGEFMPSGEEGTLEALKCAACDCHRNFHRKEVDGETAFSPGSRRSSIMLSPLQLPPPLPSPSSALHHHHHHHHQKFSIAPIIQPMNVAFGSGGGGGGTESSSEDLNVFQSNNNVEGAGGVPLPQFSLSKKRFRTKFTQEQKEKMMEFAEKVGWRIQKQDEEEVERFCADVGVKRQVLRVWMHNNKNSIKNKNDNFPTTTTTTSLSFENAEGEGGAAADDDA